jgi:hypothetical protein
MALLLVLFLLLAAAIWWALSFGGKRTPGVGSTSGESASRSVAEVNRAAMRGETGKWQKLPSDSERSGPPPVRTGPRGGRYTEAKTREGRRYRRYF